MLHQTAHGDPNLFRPSEFLGGCIVTPLTSRRSGHPDLQSTAHPRVDTAPSVALPVWPVLGQDPDSPHSQAHETTEAALAPEAKHCDVPTG